MRILFIGDVVSKPGRSLITEFLPDIRKEHSVDIVGANADNLAGGRGATEATIREMMESGVDFFTGGDHIFHHKEFEESIEDLPVVRAANYPADAPGRGYSVFDLGEKGSLLVISLLGRTSFGGTSSYLEDPFRTASGILDKFVQEDNLFSLVDFHAEATSERNALGFYLDGKATAVVGTHTHIPTCDARVLSAGTMYISDVGMTGNIDSVLGVQTDIIINLFLTAQPQRFKWANTGTKAFRSVLLDTDTNQIKRLDFEK